MKWVSIHDYEEAHRRWDEHWPRRDTCTWFEFVGQQPVFQHNINGGTFWQLTEASAERVRLIATSPHYQTLLKAMAIQYMEDPMLFIKKDVWK